MNRTSIPGRRSSGASSACNNASPELKVVEINRYVNLVLLHGHCHDEIHGKRC
jgi:hypothetical protein